MELAQTERSVLFQIETVLGVKRTNWLPPAFRDDARLMTFVTLLVVAVVGDAILNSSGLG